MRSRVLCVALLALIGSQSGCATLYERPITIVNAKVYDDRAIDDTSSALVVRGGAIDFVGGDAEALSRSRWDAKVIDAEGRLLLPGFIDAHVHPMFGALMDSACQLQEVDSVAALRETLTRCRAEADDELLLAFGLNQSVVPLAPGIFGDAFEDQPVLLIAYDCHTAFLNRAGLETFGISADTPSPEDGFIEKDSTTGEPTGLILDGALHNVLMETGDSGLFGAIGMLRDFVRDANEMGYTSLFDAGGDPQTAGFYSLVDRLGLLDARIHSAFVLMPKEPLLPQFAALYESGAFGASSLTGAGTIKLLIDGVIESNTGALEPGYGLEADPPPPYFDPDELRELVVEADRQGVMVHMHATGDRAVNLAIDSVAAAREANGDTGPVHTVAHAELISPTAIPRLAPLRMALNTTPIWIAPPDETYDTYLRIVGPQRIDWLQPLRSILDSRAPLSFGSDYPVTSNDPFLAIETAVTRKQAVGDNDRAFQADERISVGDAIESFTGDAARQLMEERRVGALRSGMAADLILVDRNLFEIPHDSISETRVDLTVVDGQIVHQREEAFGAR